MAKKCFYWLVSDGVAIARAYVEHTTLYYFCFFFSAIDFGEHRIIGNGEFGLGKRMGLQSILNEVPYIRAADLITKYRERVLDIRNCYNFIAAFFVCLFPLHRFGF